MTAAWRWRGRCLGADAAKRDSVLPHQESAALGQDWSPGWVCSASVIRAQIATGTWQRIRRRLGLESGRRVGPARLTRRVGEGIDTRTARPTKKWHPRGRNTRPQAGGLPNSRAISRPAAPVVNLFLVRALKRRLDSFCPFFARDALVRSLIDFRAYSFIPRSNQVMDSSAV